MPTYQYRCKACGHELEEFQGMSAAPLLKCPKCGKRKLVRVISGAGLVFKGSGFYLTDYKKRGSSTSETTKETEAVDSGEESKTTGSGEESKTAGSGRASKTTDSAKESKRTDSGTEKRSSPAGEKEKGGSPRKGPPSEKA